MAFLQAERNSCDINIGLCCFQERKGRKIRKGNKEGKNERDRDRDKERERNKQT